MSDFVPRDDMKDVMGAKTSDVLAARFPVRSTVILSVVALLAITVPLLMCWIFIRIINHAFFMIPMECIPCLPKSGGVFALLRTYALQKFLERG